jgi:hypothetical protein
MLYKGLCSANGFTLLANQSLYFHLGIASYCVDIIDTHVYDI